jgi:hypothetical protein
MITSRSRSVTFINMEILSAMYMAGKRRNSQRAIGRSTLF